MFKLVDDVLSKFLEESEQWNDKRVVWENVGLVERYVKGKLGVHVHILASIGDVAYQYCIIYERAAVDIGDGDRTIGVKINLAGLLADNAEATVLVDDVQLVEHPEAVATQVVGVFLKRLQLLDKCPSVFREDGESFLPLPFEVRFLAEDREFQSLPVGRRILLGFLNSQYVDEVVQAAPQIMHHLPDNHTHLGRGHGSPLTNHQILSGVKVLLMDNFARVCIDPALADFIELREVLVRPLQLRPDTTQEVRHD
ncbi:MAG TPA: hypothetical protein VHF70_06010 [Rubrobacteraceae bacterium]|nr:hypothetical protein [Rubrobacteraceae bacterium]